uniref:Uncharacterized protein n=1 Tax=Octopus bimaculoides TaxID=37653 RepID=A0A0L8GIK2_OCTBM
MRRKPREMRADEGKELEADDAGRVREMMGEREGGIIDITLREREKREREREREEMRRKIWGEGEE